MTTNADNHHKPETNSDLDGEHDGVEDLEVEPQDGLDPKGGWVPRRDCDPEEEELQM